jgi:murein DD-endopeptidase MepM/ murein hydrolase activator NlpD
MGANGNSGIHTTTGAVYQLATMPAIVSPPSPTTPAKVPTLVHPVADPRWRKVTQGFGARPQYYSQFKIDGVPLKGHEGIDFGTPPDSWIVAVDAGRVVEVEDQGAKGYGRYIKIVHTWGESVYAHLSGFVVRLGDAVQAGDIIAKSGYTGNVDPVGPAGAHLHFGLRVNPFNRQDGWGGYVDPAPYLINVGTPEQPQPTTQLEIVKAIASAALEFDVDSDLLLSQALAESSFNPRAVSNKGAKGLLQIMPNTWAEQSALIGAGNDPFDPQQNARVGARYMKYLLGALGNKPFDALVAYGWGIGNVLGDAPYPDEWVGYANKIIHGRDLLKAVG